MAPIAGIRTARACSGVITIAPLTGRVSWRRRLPGVSHEEGSILVILAS
jgi:hypothetical protein